MIQSLLEFLHTLTTPERLIHLLSTVLTGWYGYAALCGIVFSETGLLVGFFLPGDSLLFTAGVVAGAGQLNIFAINVLLMISAVAGNATGYSLGRRAGPRVFNRPDSLLFKQEHLRKTRIFYEKHGGKTIVYAQFVPIIRTFAPFVAGIARMKYLRFASFNVFGAIGWVFSMTMLGYSLGSVPFVRRHFEKAIILVILLSLLPIVAEYAKSRLRKRTA